MDKRTQLSAQLANIYEELVAITAQREVVDKYVGAFGLSYVVDEQLAYLSGDSAATTYFGFTISRGQRTYLSRLEQMNQNLKAIIENVELLEGR